MPTDETRSQFSVLPNPVFLTHDNSGYDIGAYGLAAKLIPADLMLFFGSSTVIRSNNWAQRVVESYVAHGRGIYGSMGHQGDNGYGVWPHIRTTGFWLPPDILTSYFSKIAGPEHRYPFEHGSANITQWARSTGLQTWVVGNWGEHPWGTWGSIQNGYQNGNQSDLVFGDRLSDP